VIVAMAPALVSGIRFEPILPPLRAQLSQRMPQGSVIKCEAVYDEPFWRKSGLSGNVIGDVNPINLTFDNSPPDGSPGVMLAFMYGRNARAQLIRSPRARRDSVLRSLATYFGSQALRPKGYFEGNWASEEFTRGCYVGYAPPGVLLDYGPWLRKPFRRVHWAGTETSDYWIGYMDGAVRSGIRAAAEVVEAL
jgi:monoamine oxidase